ncbi:MAG: hypothetical protein M1827_006301 [Pycnora praestabilis]|nr:MAG: hypothetical protein M1827_006301 [Pycnora praestabilis]
MNNNQFRRLVLDTPNAGSGGSSTNGSAATPRREGASPATLGSRMRSSIPMTPRSVLGSSGVDFARQLAERNQESSDRPQKRFRSSAAPKGTKLATGYRDRTQDRISTEEDDKASRVQALEELLKLQQIDLVTFEKLRDQITGGDIAATHLVKGLDYKLLERVRKGEDVLSEPVPVEKDNGEPEKSQEDVDEEFEKLEETEVAPVAKEKVIKKGEMAPPPVPIAIAGQKRSRDQILAELKASRQAAAAAKAAANPALGPKFRKLGERKEHSRIERDEQGREVLITVDEEGRVKRKVRRTKIEDEDTERINGLLMPDMAVKPLGMDVPEAVAPNPVIDEDDGDIFQGAGADYDPLGGLGDDDNSSSEDEEGALSIDDSHSPRVEAKEPQEPSPSPPKNNTAEMPPPPLPSKPSQTPRNYFTTPTSQPDGSQPSTSANPLTDPAILAALKKASSITPITNPSSSSSSAANDEEAAKALRRQKLLSSHDRDADDMDMGFGSSRFEDEEDGEDKKVKLSVWGVGGKGADDAEEDGKGDGKGKRKRGAKKRKGDKNSATDVLKVMERRKEKG